MSSPDSKQIQAAAEMPPLPKRKEETDERGNGFGTCLSCKKFKRVWAHICGLCGSACE